MQEEKAKYLKKNDWRTKPVDKPKWLRKRKLLDK